MSIHYRIGGVSEVTLLEVKRENRLNEGKTKRLEVFRSEKKFFQ